MLSLRIFIRILFHLLRPHVRYEQVGSLIIQGTIMSLRHKAT